MKVPHCLQFMMAMEVKYDKISVTLFGVYYFDVWETRWPSG